MKAISATLRRSSTFLHTSQMETLTARPQSSPAPAGRVVDLLRELSRLSTRRQILDLLAQRLPALLPVSDRASMAFVDDTSATDGETSEWMRFYRLLPADPDVDLHALPRVKRQGTPVGQTVTEGVPRVVADVRTDRNITFGHAAKDSIRSTISVPIFISGRAVGSLNTGSTTPNACTAEMVQRVQDVAAVVGPAMWAAEQREGAREGARTVAHEGARAATHEGARAVTHENRARILPTIGRSRPPVGRRQDALQGESDAFATLMERAARAAKSDANILITGETGVGKTALARVIHGWSDRASGPFVTTHLGALSPTLVESEMFGHERGAFTGAATRRIGRFESATGGTLFIDELGDTPLEVQAKVLRVVQEGEFERVGGNTPIQTDARLITATNFSLDAAVRDGRFRADLLHRLNVLPLHVPPLRERGDDVEILAEAILAQLRRKLSRPLRLSAEGLRRLRAHAWPGNIRELETSLQRAAALEPNDALDLTDLEIALDASGGTRLHSNLRREGHRSPLAPRDVDNHLAAIEDDTHGAEQWPTMKDHQRHYLQRVLSHTGGVIEGERGAAKLLGLRPSTLRSQLQRLGLSRSTKATKGGPA